MFDKILKGIIAVSLFTGLLFLSLGLGSGKYEVKTEIKIEAPVETVFSYILDGNNSPEWVAGFKSRKLISGEKGQPGSKSELIFIENEPSAAVASNVFLALINLIISSTSNRFIAMN